MKRYRIVIWGTGIEYEKYISKLIYFDSLKEIEIVGITSNDNYYREIDGYEFFPKKYLNTWIVK